MITQLKNIPLGSIIKTKTISWKIIAKNHEGYPNNSITLMSTNSIINRCFDTASYRWDTSSIRTFLNTTFYDSLDSIFKETIITTNLINSDYNSNIYYTQDNIFLASLTELNASTPYPVNIGFDFKYFTNDDSRKIINNTWWTRTPTSNGIQCIYRDGSVYIPGITRNDISTIVFCNVRDNIYVSNEIESDGSFIIINTPHRCLINQNKNYYSTKSNFFSLGQPTDSTQLENWYNKYGSEDVNIITQNLNNKEFPMTKDESGIWKTDFQLDMNEVIDNIELVDTDENNKCIKYNCNDYRILDLCDDQFKLTMCKIQ